MIQKVGLRYKGNDTVSVEQFKLLHSLFSKDTPSLFSPLGLEFVMTFGTSSDAVLTKDIKKLFQSTKSRDSLLHESKKSFFYSLIFKVITTIYLLQDDD